MNEGRIEPTPSYESLVRNCYNLIDSNNFESLYNLFSEDIIYERNDVILNGKEEFVDFYKNIRKLSGIHTVNNIEADKNIITIRGNFTGTNNGKYTDFQFTDIFTFNDKKKVSHRKTTY